MLTLSKSFNGFKWSNCSKFPKNGTGVGPGGKFLGRRILNCKKRRKAPRNNRTSAVNMVTDLLDSPSETCYLMKKRTDTHAHKTTSFNSAELLKLC